MQAGPWDERDTIVGYLEQQLRAIRYAAHGLTDEEARRRPTASALSVGGLVKHVAYVCRGWQRRQRMVETGDYAITAEGRREFGDSFVLREDETLADALAALDRDAAAYLDAVRAVDPADLVVQPPTPWDGVLEPTEVTARFITVHGIEEFARHAGHADILREQLDGATAPALRMAAEGLPGNDYVQPWTRRA